MIKTPAPSSRRRTVVGLAAAIAVLGVMPGVGVAGDGSHHRGSCPAAESLVPGTAWTTKTLAKGVTVSTGTADDSAGQVNMHILRVDLTQRRTKVVPLMHSLAQRLPLTTLAANKPRLVAATNTGYFDFQYGAPTDPLIANGTPRVISSNHEQVVGIGKNGLMEAGNVWLAATVNAGGNTHSLSALNETYPPAGLGVYNTRWGSAHVPGGWNATTRSVTGGTLASGQVPHHGATVPAKGYLLQARGRSASDWLTNLAAGTKISIASAVKTNAKSPFVQAYGVGLQLVEKPGVAKTGFSCDSANTKQPARTAVGWSHGGKTMIIAVVAQHPHTSMHGLDNDQMSKLMVQLGVQQAYNFDGSGSTELLAKFRHSSLKLRSYPADGAERPMPVGLGISIKPPKHHKKHH
jgi:hypothetical protein